MRRIPLSLAVLLCSSACATASRQQRLEARAAQFVYHRPSGQVEQEVRHFFEERGYPMAEVSHGGALRTEWKTTFDGGEVGQSHERYVISIRRLTASHCRLQVVRLRRATAGMEQHHPTFGGGFSSRGAERPNVNSARYGKGTRPLPMGPPVFHRAVELEWELVRRIEPERARFLEAAVDRAVSDRGPRRDG